MTEHEFRNTKFWVWAVIKVDSLAIGSRFWSWVQEHMLRFAVRKRIKDLMKNLEEI